MRSVKHFVGDNARRRSYPAHARCRRRRARARAWRSNDAISLRISACATPEVELADKKFSAGGQAAGDAATHATLCRQCGCSSCTVFHRLQKTAEKKCFFENAVVLVRATDMPRLPRAAHLPGVDAAHCDGRLKKNCKRVLTVKKSVIRFRPADIAAKQSEQNRHQADQLVQDVHRSTIDGGVGSASLQENSSRPDHAPVSPFDAGVSVSVPSRITCGRFPTTACRRGVWFNWAFHLHSSLTRSQLHGH